MNVDDVVRGLRSSVRGPAEGLIDEIVAAAPSTGRVSRRRVNGRALLVAATVSVALVVVLALAVVLRGGGRPDPVPATPVIPPARVDWGMTATVKLTPDPGVTIQEMRERFATALAFRVDGQDGAGVEILSENRDRVRVRVPGAEIQGQVSRYLYFDRLVVVDEKDGVLATGPSIRALAREAAKHTRSAGKLAYYVQVRYQGRWQTPMRATTRAQAERLLGTQPQGARHEILAVPYSMIITGADASSSSVSLVSMYGHIPAGDIQNVRTDGRFLHVALRSVDAARAGTRVWIFLDGMGVGRLGGGSALLGRGMLAADGTIDIEMKNRYGNALAAQDLGGRLTVVDAQRFGKRPAIAGRPFVPPAGLRQFVDSDVPKSSRWVSVADGRFGKATYSLVVAETGGVISRVRLFDRRNPQLATGPATQIHRDPKTSAKVATACPGQVGTPRVATCASSGFIAMKRGAVMRFVTSYVGPVQPEITRVAVDWNGTTHEAVVKNGWWFIRFAVDVPTNGRKDYEVFEDVGTPTTRAWDRDGDEVPVPSTWW